jgi:hypothetical protein
MGQSSSKTPLTNPTSSDTHTAPSNPPDAQPSYVKLAMRNMVRKGGKSLKHFALTVIGLLGILIGLAYLTH